ncbi:MAG TPA: zinc ribbon domain-containing protein [Pyrinomonadaceae bacterium]|jgi:hypothetical protein|nr:zinc ribbon domain-containing protein [Pyrinomonadaceae bacterium]
MFCPQCGSSQSDELKFCKTCGANLNAVRMAIAARDEGDKFDWSKTWVAEMFLSEAERKRRNEELERQRGITPEVKRYNEIKAGVIVACVGLGVMIFLNVFMEGIILSGQPSPSDAEILRRVWVSGVIPFLVGLALIINGLFVSKRQAEAARRSSLHAAPDPTSETPDSLRAPQPHTLRPADTSEIIPPDFSVTDSTTRHLNVPAPNKLRDTDNT